MSVDCKNYKEHNYIWNLVRCGYENNKYLGSIIDDLVITCDETIEETKTKQKPF